MLPLLAILIFWHLKEAFYGNHGIIIGVFMHYILYHVIQMYRWIEEKWLKTVTEEDLALAVSNISLNSLCWTH